MRPVIYFFLIVILPYAITGCSGRGSKNDGNLSQTDLSSVADTGFTGIKQFYSKDFLSYEVTFKNGVKEGLMKTYYASGKLRTTFWFENGLKEDTAVWYFEDGRVFRKTPFRRDSMNGTQIQYYKSGKVRAMLQFKNDLRVPYLEEFTDAGKKINDYPSVVIKSSDTRNSDGTYKISVSLDKPGVKATFYRGDYINGLFDPGKLKKINNSETTGAVTLKKVEGEGERYVGIISEISTTLGNKVLVYNRIDLPFTDMK